MLCKQWCSPVDGAVLCGGSSINSLSFSLPPCSDGVCLQTFWILLLCQSSRRTLSVSTSSAPVPETSVVCVHLAPCFPFSSNVSLYCCQTDLLKLHLLIHPLPLDPLIIFMAHKTAETSQDGISVLSLGLNNLIQLNSKDCSYFHVLGKSNHFLPTFCPLHRCLDTFPDGWSLLPASTWFSFLLKCVFFPVSLYLQTFLAVFPS